MKLDHFFASRLTRTFGLLQPGFLQLFTPIELRSRTACQHSHTDELHLFFFDCTANDLGTYLCASILVRLRKVGAMTHRAAAIFTPRQPRTNAESACCVRVARTNQDKTGKPEIKGFLEGKAQHASLE
jgi:hypothetical protein